MSEGLFSVSIVAVGRLKERFFLDACAEYSKRLGSFCRLSLIELAEQRLPDSPSQAQIAAGLAKEADAIRGKIPKGAWVCVLTPEGKMLSSETFANRLRDVKTRAASAACFVLGSSFGLDPSVKLLADFSLSLSPMTFPHHLARVMLLEQLYRAEMIQAGGRYHK